MNKKTTLRFLLTEEIFKSYSSISKFAQKSGLSRSIFSLIFRKENPKPIPFEILVKITLALDYEEDYFFDLYIKECLLEEKVSKSRLIPLLKRCILLDRQDCLHNVLQHLNSDLQSRHVRMIFEVCVSFIHNPQFTRSKSLIQWLMANEIHLSSENRAIIRYATFRLCISKYDNEQNLLAAIQFDPFISLLPNNFRLDALLQLTNIYFNLDKWIEMEQYADQLLTLAKTVFVHDFVDFKYSIERHPVVYYGQGYLQKGNSLEHQGRYTESEIYISGYEDLGWFSNLDDLGWVEVKKFDYWAQANRFNLAILQGDFSLIDSYLKFLEKHPHEILPSLLTILESVNRHEISLNNVIDELMIKILKTIEGNYYDELFNHNRLASLYSQIAEYHIRRNNPLLAGQFSLKAFELSKSLNNTKHFRVLASLSSTLSSVGI